MEFQLHKGRRAIDPNDAAREIRWGRLSGLTFYGQRIVFISKAYSVEARTASRLESLPYDTWLPSTRMVDGPGFEFLLRAPDKLGDFPRVFIRWAVGGVEPLPRSMPLIPITSITPIALDRPVGRFPCGACRFHRAPVSLAESLLGLVSDHAGTALTQIRRQLLDEETSLEVEESEEYDALMTSLDFESGPVDVLLSRRPSSHDYCGAEEARSVWYLEEAKNPDGHCPSMQPLESAVGERTCDTCASHRRSPAELFDAVQDCAVSLGAQGSSLANEIERELSGRAEFEAVTAYRMIGYLPVAPVVLPGCDQLSSATRHAVGPVLNPAGRCRTWTPRRGSGLSPAQEAALALWQEVLRLRAVMEDGHGAAGNAFALSVAEIMGPVADSERYDKARTAFLAAALPALGFAPGKAAAMVLHADRVLRDERRWPYSPPIQSRTT